MRARPTTPRWLVLAPALVVAAGLPLAPVALAPVAHAQDATESARLERAWSSWSGPEGAKVIAEGLRLTSSSGAETVGRISRKFCGLEHCTGSSVIRMLPHNAFALDPLLSSASLRFGFLGLAQGARWEAEDGESPRAHAGGRTTIARDALAAGEIYGLDMDEAQMRQARLVGGVDVPVLPPSVPPDPSPVPMDGWLPASHSLDCWTPRSAERAFARAHNGSRLDDGLRRLHLDADLSRVARAHTKDMIAKDSLHHSTALQLRRRISGWTLLGENVGVGGSPASLMRAFLDSPGHRANILHAGFRYFGVGTKHADGRLWVTVIFEAIDDPSTSLRMPRCG